MAVFESNPLVGIVMGSASDREYLLPAAEVLERFEVPYEAGVKSAHRTPARMRRYGRTAVARGLKVIIAAAGGSAHLPGMLAAETRLPVLGVAVGSKPHTLEAALGSMDEMPGGVPLAFMGMLGKGAENAGLEAVRILALTDPLLGEAYESYLKERSDKVIAEDRQMTKTGLLGYEPPISS